MSIGYEILVLLYIVMNSILIVICLKADSYYYYLYSLFILIHTTGVGCITFFEYISGMVDC